MNQVYIQRLKEKGFDVDGFCLTIDPPGPHLTFSEMEHMWQNGDEKLLNLYSRLEDELGDKDVLINTTGINLHPEFVKELPVFTVFQCFDDPESSEILSRPVANAYDLCLVGNIAEVDTYRKWGVKNVAWTPMGLLDGFFDPKLTYDQIFAERRDIDLFMMIDRLSPWRKKSLDKLAEEFPSAHFYGRGWPRGYLPYDQQLSILRRAKIGINIHNSTGPINFRTYYLPANGIMQICDNKGHLGDIFELGKEVVGFDTVEECIDLCKYYLDHDKERQKIAAEGWKRAVSDYTPVAVFERNLEIIYSCMLRQDRKKSMHRIAMQQRQRTRMQRSIHKIAQIFHMPLFNYR